LGTQTSIYSFGKRILSKKNKIGNSQKKFTDWELMQESLSKKFSNGNSIEKAQSRKPSLGRTGKPTTD
jgi:hypothetical protein